MGPLGRGEETSVPTPGPRHATSTLLAAGATGSKTWSRGLDPKVVPNRKGGGGLEAIELLKQRAARAIPAMRGKISDWNQGKGGPPSSWEGTRNFGGDANLRNTGYTSMWQQLEPNRGRFWFQAAGMVTGRGGIKDMDSNLSKALGIVFTPLWPSDMTFVVAGNAFLYPYNLCNFYILREQGEVPGLELLRGEDLDRGLVVLEQTLIQGFIDSFGWPSQEEKRAALGRLSKAFRSWVTNEWVRAAIDQLFGVGAGGFDFGSLDHRIRLGIELVGRLRRP